MKLFILFGSQTGNAREVAFDLALEARRRLVETVVLGLDQALEVFFTIKVAIFVVATTGQGDVPENMKGFWRGIMAKSLSSDFLNGLVFTVFGLGDSTYENFNVVARKLWVRLKQLGAKSFVEKGLGDDIHDFGYEAEYHPWCEKVWQGLASYFPLLPQIEPITGLLPSLYIVSDALDCGSSCPADNLEVKTSELLTSAYGETYQLTFEHLPFSPGDALSIYPKNDSDSVQSLMSRLNWKDRAISIQKNPESPFDFKESLPSNLLLSSLLTNFIDLHHPASRYFMFILSQFAEGLHKSKLEEISKKDLLGRNEYHRYITKEHRNVLEVLHDFSSISYIPLEYFLESVRIIRPREFSIAGSEELRILVSRVAFSTPLARRVEGFCSGFLAKVRKNDVVSAKVVTGGLKVPDGDSPIVLIATGTGISPLWAILERRVKTGCYKNLLFFGTRHPEHDFYFREEIERMEKSGFCRSFIAFSQFGRKTYVQDLIPAQWELVNSFLLDGGFVYICGKAKTLVKSVKNNLKDCLQHQFSVKEAEDILKRLENSKRLCSENW